MSKEEMILSTYMMLRDYLEDNSDFEKMHDLIEQMAGINAEKAYNMWYPLLRKYENVVTKVQSNKTYYFVDQILNILGESLGCTKFDTMILQDNYLYDLLIKKYRHSIVHYNYTQKMLIRLIESDQSL